MSVHARVRATRWGIALAVTGLLLSSAAAVAAVVPYRGWLNFGAPLVSVTCAGGKPTSVTVSVPYNSTHLTRPVSRTIDATFTYDGSTLAWLWTAPGVPTTIRPGRTGSLTHRFAVPTSRTYSAVTIGLISGARFETAQTVRLDCSPAPDFRAPTSGIVSHRCGAMTSARVINGSNRAWTVTPRLASGTARAVAIAPHSSATVVVGRGVDRFTLSAHTSAPRSSATVAILVFDAACR